MASIWLAELLKLTRAERFEIAMALWESLSEAAIEADSALSPEQRIKLRRRLAEYEADPDSAVPWEAVLARHGRTGRPSVEGSP
jgi:putative addiction module component (TIGR02574 family)